METAYDPCEEAIRSATYQSGQRVRYQRSGREETALIEDVVATYSLKGFAFAFYKARRVRKNGALEKLYIYLYKNQIVGAA